VGSGTFVTNGTIHNLDVPAQIIGGRTMVPIAPILRTVGLDVIWDGATRTVDIVPAGFATPVPPIATLPPVTDSSLVGTWVGRSMHDHHPGIATFVFNADGTGFQDWEGPHNEGDPWRSYFTWVAEGGIIWFGLEFGDPDITTEGSSLTIVDDVLTMIELWEYGSNDYILTRS